MRKILDSGAMATAYREIKTRILDMRYAAGQKLSETRLCADLGLGRSPIRAALARLKEEGWVAVAPQSGTYVRRMSSREIDEVIELRVLLETHAARIAAGRITPAEISRLRAGLSSLKLRTKNGSLEAFSEVDDQLHGAVYEACGNELVTGLIRSLREKVRWVLPTSATPLELRHAVRELERIVEALSDRDGEAAARFMGEHVGRSGAFYKKFRDVSLTKRAKSNEDDDQPKQRRSAS